MLKTYHALWCMHMHMLCYTLLWAMDRVVGSINQSVCPITFDFPFPSNRGVNESSLSKFGLSGLNSFILEAGSIGLEPCSNSSSSLSILVKLNPTLIVRIM